MLLQEILKLTPFIVTNAIYWRSDLETRLHDPWTKCAPIFSLIVYLLLHVPTSGGGFLKDNNGSMHPRRIVLGLFFCMLGDAFLTVDEESYFLAGMVAFGIGHVFYVAAFGGGARFKMGLNMIVVAIWPIYLFKLLPCITRNQPDLTLPTVFYAVVMTALVWTSGARFEAGSKGWVAKLCGAVGAMVFASSDMTLVHSMTCEEPVPHHPVVIMVTYYGAQLLITLSALEAILDDTKRKD